MRRHSKSGAYTNTTIHLSVIDRFIGTNPHGCWQGCHGSPVLVVLANGHPLNSHDSWADALRRAFGNSGKTQKDCKTLSFLLAICKLDDMGLSGGQGWQKALWVFFSWTTPLIKTSVVLANLPYGFVCFGWVRCDLARLVNTYVSLSSSTQGNGETKNLGLLPGSGYSRNPSMTGLLRWRDCRKVNSFNLRGAGASLGMYNSRWLALMAAILALMCRSNW